MGQSMLLLFHLHFTFEFSQCCCVVGNVCDDAMYKFITHNRYIENSISPLSLQQQQSIVALHSNSVYVYN
eukprot:m.53480 g.53480  ORF g.53480 m.53480 type:complete len:70 (+) comp11043_c2_seq3:1020-1229(+)